MVSGYLKDDHFDQRIEISRKLASPSRATMTARQDESGLGMGSSKTPVPNEADKITS